MKKILCPIDVYQAPECFASSKVFAAAAELALGMIASESKPHGQNDEPAVEMSFTYISVSDPPNMPALAMLPSAIDHSVELEKLKQICSTRVIQDMAASDSAFADSKIKISTRLEQGLPGPRIVELAEAEKTDWIVMATHGRSGVSRLLIGSVAEYVLRHAPCPVVTVKNCEVN